MGVKGQMGIVAFLEKLLDVIRWKSVGFSEEIRSAYYAFLANRLDGAMLALQHSDPEAAEAASLMYKVLTAKMRLDFISAPHIASLLIWPELLSQTWHRRFFLKTLGICTGVIQGDTPLHGPRGELMHSSSGNLGSDTTPTSRYSVSFDGELAVPFMDRGGNHLGPVSQSDAQSILCKLDKAECLIGSINADAQSFSIANTEVLAFRYETEYPKEFTSGSFRSLPGFHLICNCHLASVTEPMLVDAIVHEAVHTIIYRFEAFGEPLRRADAPVEFHLPSPWTGAMLNVDSFAQACLVWFALHHFWKQAPANDRDAYALYQRATGGFLSTTYRNSCRLSADHLAPGVATMLENLDVAL